MNQHASHMTSSQWQGRACWGPVYMATFSKFIAKQFCLHAGDDISKIMRPCCSTHAKPAGGSNEHAKHFCHWHFNEAYAWSTTTRPNWVAQLLRHSVCPTLLKTLHFAFTWQRMWWRFGNTPLEPVFISFCFQAFSCKHTVKTKVLYFHLCKWGLTTYPGADVFPFPVPNVLKWRPCWECSLWHRECGRASHRVVNIFHQLCFQAQK